MTTYTHLIALSPTDDEQLIKEYLDIALVSASYDIPTAVFIAPQLVYYMQQHKPIALQQSLNMLAEFDVPVFSNARMQLFDKTLACAELEQLQQNSKHALLF